jgi:hypothetical protein
VSNEAAIRMKRRTAAEVMMSQEDEIERTTEIDGNTISKEKENTAL